MVGETSGINANSIKRNCIARALYDNVSESPDELAFSRGDLLTVLEQNTGGLEGWWLCSLRGRQGICPGNRLRIVPGLYDTGTGSFSGFPRVVSFSGGLIVNSSNPRSLSQKVVIPRRIGDVYTYDTPRSQPGLDYDVPPPARHSDGGGIASRLSRSSSLRYDSPRPFYRGPLEQYDTPRPSRDSFPLIDAVKGLNYYDSPKSQQQHYDTPRNQFGIQNTEISSNTRNFKGVQTNASLELLKQASIENALMEYDVPKPTVADRGVPSVSDRSSGVSIMSCESQSSASSSASSNPASESLSLSSIGGDSSNRSSLELQDVYDTPPEPRRVCTQKPKLPPRENRDITPATYDTPRVSSRQSDHIYDFPPQVCRDGKISDGTDCGISRFSSGSDSSCAEVENAHKELPLELNSARDMLVKLQQDVHCGNEKINNLHTAILQSNKTFTEERLEDTRLISYRLKVSIEELINFCEGSKGNAVKSGEQKLANRLHKLLQPILIVHKKIDDIWEKLKQVTWQGPQSRTDIIDLLQKVVVMTRTLEGDVRHIVSIILGHSELLFKRTPIIDQCKNFKSPQEDDNEKTPVQERPLPTVPCDKVCNNVYANDESTWVDDYDYVNLESRESIEKEHQEIKKTLPTHLRKSFDNLVKQSQFNVDSNHEKALENVKTRDTQNCDNLAKIESTKKLHLDINDRQVLSFYGKQAELHLQHLHTAIDAFYLTIESNQPPKVFIAHSKFVILSAHKLVYIGDTVYRNICNGDVRTCVLNCSNALCDAMKNTVSATKNAALQFPSVTAVQTMVDTFQSLSVLANNLKDAVYRMQ